MKKAWTYQEAGVSIRAGDEVVRRVKRLAARTTRPEVLSGIGGFSGLFSLANFTRACRGEPVLVAATDGVGTKLKVAFLTGCHDTVGIDLVAMCVNDLITCGAEPLFFLDYFATGKLAPKQAAAVLKGVVEGCAQAGCTLLGGETAELPDFYHVGEYDLAGFAVGAVVRNQIIDGKAIQLGDKIIGLRSTGLHSNGYSLARKVLLQGDSYQKLRSASRDKKSMGEMLLTPTRIYVKTVAALLKKYRIKGIAHITGGGIPGNLNRILPTGLDAQIDCTTWVPHPIFSLIQERGRIRRQEMFKTFNMGIGMMLVVSRRAVTAILQSLTGLGEEAYVVGEIVKGNQRVHLSHD